MDKLPVNNRVPSCAAARLILENRESNGEMLKYLQAIENPTYGELVAKHLIQCEKAWKEEDLWKK